MDYASYLKRSPEPNPYHHVVDMGSVHLPTGKIYCCDPFLTQEVAALDLAVEPGNFPVRLCVADVPNWGKRIALASLTFSDQPVKCWARATYQLDGDRLAAFRVDAGLGAFMDEDTAALFAGAVGDYYEANPEGNYYDDVLAEEFKRNADMTRRGHTGDWDLHVPVLGDPRNVAMFASGLGDGSYSAFWGIDRDNRPAMVVADFDIFG